MASAGFGLNLATVRRGLQASPVFLAVFFTVMVGLPLLLVAAAVSGQLFQMSDISGRSYLLLIAAGVIHFVVGRYGSYRAVGAIGTNRATPIQTVSGPYTLLMALFLLGESISITNGIGIVIVILAPTIMVSRTGGARRHADQGEPGSNPGAGDAAPIDVRPSRTAAVTGPRWAEGYFFGIIGALGFGTSPLLIREAIGGTGLGIAGALVSYSAAAVLLLLFLLVPGRLADLQGIDRTAARWFLLGSVAVFFSQMFRFIALDLTTVSVVNPLQRTSAIFIVLFAFLLNRQLETFGPRVLAAIALSVVGSVFVVL